MRVLNQWGAGRQFLDRLLEAALADSRLKSPDRALVSELSCGVVRWRGTLDWLIARKTGDRAQPPRLQTLLHLGLYQLFWLSRVPDHAAVNETVTLARQEGYGSKAGFVNALLRGYAREKEATRRLLAELRQSNPAVGYSHPAWLVERWVQRWGLPQTQQLLDWNNTPPRTYARLNTLRVEGSRLLDRWRQEEDVEYDFGRWEWLPENLVFALKSHPPLAGLGTFKEGCFYVQDPSTLLAVHLVDPKPGDAILDLCAAPGGKTTYLAQLMGNQGIVVAEDASVPRLELLRENCARLGATCVLIRPAADRLPEEHRPWAEDHPLELPGAGPFGGGGVSEPRAQPPRQPPISPPPKAMSVSVTRGPCPTLFDKVLVDAPCSNTGVMRRRVDLRWRVRPEELSRLQSLQLGLLERAASRLRAGGTLVYGTCSLEPEENAAVVSTFLSQRRDYRLDHERALTPVTDHVDGAYTARLRHAA